MKSIAIQNQTTTLRSPLLAVRADTFASRLRGLMFTHEIQPDHGFLLVQDRENRLDSAIHMFFVDYDLGTVWLDTQGKVVDRCLARRWRPFYMPSKPARYTLEVHPDRLSEFSLDDQILFETLQA